ncbi:MAG: 16S rRNA (cytidine(1402)-2'-O)-methyltransferase [Pseudomonadota bacterium]
MGNAQKVHLKPGLYFVATPIGTARDITLRALDILESADVIAAEDTRSMRRLLDIHGVALGGRPLIAYHDHNGAQARPKLLAYLAEGKSVAYASEAGMPLIADPGYDLSRSAGEAGHPVTCAPGASAALTALTLAGLPTDRFFFAGFLPNAKGARRAALEELREVQATLVLYESPKRIAASLGDCADVLGGERKAALCRELTKKFEEVKRGTLAELHAVLQEAPVKGEIVMIIDRAHEPAVNTRTLEEDLTHAMQTMRVRDAADVVARAHGLPRRQVYQMALDMGRET